MANIFLHLGMHKTASTTLQRFCHINRRWLHGCGVVYPRLTFGHINHRRFGHLLCKAPIADIRAGIIDDFWRSKVSPVLKGIGEHTCLISYEGLFSLFWRTDHEERVRALQRCLEGHRVQALVYARSQDAWCDAMYNQLVKNGATARTYSDWVDEALRRGFADVAQGVRFWSSALGRENLSVRIFERDHLIDRDILKDFAATAGISSLQGAVLPPAENPRLTAPLLELKRRLNQSVAARPLGPALKPLMIRWQSRHPGVREPGLRREEAQRIMSCYRGGNRWLAREVMGMDADTPFATTPLSQETLSLEQMPIRELLRLCAYGY
jgi:hypothetical protein